MREIRFNVAGDPKDDKPWIQPDRSVDANGVAVPGLPPDPIPMTVGTEDAAGTFLPGQAPFNRGSARIPEDNTGGAWTFYQNGTKTFRIILPPLNIQVQAEAGQPPQLPPEYGGDSDKVALHYSWAPPVRVDVRLEGRNWRDSDGFFMPLGETMMYTVGHVKRGKTGELAQNYDYLKANGVDFKRSAGQLDWPGQEVDPFWDDYPQVFAQDLEFAYSHGLLTHLFAIGGKCRDPQAAARIMMSVIMDGRRHMVILGEATNEDKALSSADAIAVARILAPLGAFCVGMGNTSRDGNIIPSDQAAGAPISTLHTERTPPEGRMVRQCWDFKPFGPRASLSGEPPGTGSSVGQMNEPQSHANLRAGEAICGATMHVHHCGSGVTGNNEGNQHGQRFAFLWDSPQHAEQLRALVNSVKRLPADIGGWQRRFNDHQPVDIPAGNVEKLYGSTDENRFAEIAVDADGPVTFRAQWACNLRIVNAAEDTLLFDDHLNAGQTISVTGLQHYVLVGERA